MQRFLVWDTWDWTDDHSVLHLYRKVRASLGWNSWVSGEWRAPILSRAAWTNNCEMCVCVWLSVASQSLLRHIGCPRGVTLWFVHEFPSTFTQLHSSVSFLSYSIFFFPPRKFSPRNFFFFQSGKLNKTLDLKFSFSCSCSAVFSWLSDFIIRAFSAPFLASFLS